MKAVHIFPASVMALAIGVTAIGASAKDDARKETIEIANVQGGPAAPQAKYDGIDGESNDAVVRNPAAAHQSMQAPKPDNQQGYLIITLENCAVGSASCSAPANNGAGSRSAAQYNPKEVGIDSLQSPRDAASGQAISGDTSAPGAGNSFSASQDTRMDSQIVRDGSAQTGNGYLKIEGIDGESKVNASPGAGDQFIGGTGDEQDIRKPRPNNRPRKGKRMHKP